MGHGAWDTIASRKPFVTVPRGTSVVFYSPMGRFIQVYQTVVMVRGGAHTLSPDREVKAFRQVPNLTLSDGVEPSEVKALMQSGARFARVSRDTTLEELLTTYAGNRLHWLACMPRLTGDDTPEGGFNDDYIPSHGIGI